MSARFTTVGKLKKSAAKTDADFKPASNVKYDAFPDELRKQVNDLYSRAAVAGGFDSLQPAPDDTHQHFALKQGTIYKIPARDPEFKTIGVYEKAEAANVALLDQLLEQDEIVLLGKDSWVELRNPFDRFENPSFLQLHMLRRGDTGFGFDAEKGLCVVAPGEFAALDGETCIYELRLHVIFVQFMRGSETVPVVRDLDEEARLREQREKPKLKLGLKLRSVAEDRPKKNPLEEAEKEAERKKKEDEEMDWDEGDDDRVFW